MAKEKKYNSLKLKLSNWFVANKLTNNEHNVKTCSLDKAKLVGITFAATEPKDIDIVKKIVGELTIKGIKTSVLGYIPEKKPTDFYLSEKTFNFFYDKELDWLLRPNSDSALDFQSAEFDILIDLGSISYYPMQILISKSKSHFKVGQYQENSPFDMMIKCKDLYNLRYYFDQVIHYLSKFN